MVVDDVGRADVGNFDFDLHETERTGDFSGRRTASLALVEPDGGVRAVADDLRFPGAGRIGRCSGAGRRGRL